MEVQMTNMAFHYIRHLLIQEVTIKIFRFQACLQAPSSLIVPHEIS